MDHTLIQSRLKELPFVSGLSPSQVERLAQIATPVAWKSGAWVFREGEMHAHLYVVESGRVSISMRVPGREPLTILTVGRGEVFGWSSVFYGRPKTASARAVEDSEAFAFDSSQFRMLCDSDTGIGYMLTRRVLQAVTERLKTSRMQLLDIFGAETPATQGAAQA